VKIEELIERNLSGSHGDQSKLAFAALRVAMKALRVYQRGFPPDGETIQNYATARVAEIAKILESGVAGQRTDSNLRSVFG
jgi:hypothetical protein